MKIRYKFCAAILMSLALANGQSCLEPSCRGAEQTPVNLAERIRVLEAEDPGLLRVDQTSSLSSSILTETSKAGLTVMSFTKVKSQTNQFFAALSQSLALEATEPQLLDFLRNIGASDSPLRIRSFTVHPAPDRSRMQASVTIAGTYRLPPGGQSRNPDAEQDEYLVLSQRRHLRQAALDCYTVTKSSLPSGWQLDSLNFQDGKQMSATGQAPADQLGVLDNVRATLEKAKASDGKVLFIPPGEATMRMTPDRTNFLWSMQFDLRPAEWR